MLPTSFESLSREPLFQRLGAKKESLIQVSLNDITMDTKRFMGEKKHKLLPLKDIQVCSNGKSST